MSDKNLWIGGRCGGMENAFVRAARVISAIKPDGTRDGVAIAVGSIGDILGDRNENWGTFNWIRWSELCDVPAPAMEDQR